MGYLCLLLFVASGARGDDGSGERRNATTAVMDAPAGELKESETHQIGGV